MDKAKFPDDMALVAARDKLRTLVDVGENCPCCTQLAKVYRRKIHATMARVLILVFRTHGTEFFHLPSQPDASKLGGDFAKLAYWGLVAEEAARREDGGRAGWWKVTDGGSLWVNQRTWVPKYARLYDGRSLGLVGERTFIRDALGSKFNYEELMAGV